MSDLAQDKWHHIAWQGIEVEVPEEWVIGGIGGNREEGYLRIQDAEMPRIEIKWTTADGFVDIEKLVDGYLNKLRRDRRVARSIEIDTDASVVSKRKMKKKALRCFTWRTDVHGYGAAWYCTDCSHTVICQVTTRPDEDGPKIAERVISSMKDHPEDGWTRWAAYGFDAQAPEGFKLTAQNLMAGHIQITLKRDVAADTARSIVLQNITPPEELTLSRWGMANIMLKNKTLDEWANEEMGKRLKRMKPELTETTVNGHKAIAVSAQQLWPWEKLFRLICRFADLPYADRICGLLWHCPESNALYLAQMVVDVSNKDLPAEIGARFMCHGADGEE